MEAGKMAGRFSKKVATQNKGLLNVQNSFTKWKH